MLRLTHSRARPKVPGALDVGGKSTPMPGTAHPCAAGVAAAARTEADISPLASALPARAELSELVCGDVPSLWTEWEVLTPEEEKHTGAQVAKHVRARPHREVRFDRARRRVADTARFLLKQKDPPKPGRSAATAVLQWPDAGPSRRIAERLWIADPLPDLESLRCAWPSETGNVCCSTGSVCVPVCATGVNAVPRGG